MAVEVSPDGARVYVLADRDLRSYSTATNTQVAQVPLPTNYMDLAVSPDGTRLYLAQYFPGAVVVLDAASLAVVATVPVGNHVWDVAVSPSGDRVYGAIGPGSPEGLVVIDTATNTLVTLVPTGPSNGVAVTSASSSPPPAPVVEGATFYIDGTSSRSGVVPGSRISGFTSSAVPGLGYRLVLSRDGCRTVLAVLNANPRFANSNGVIGSTSGSVPAGTAPGRYQVCFLASIGNGTTVTGPVTLDVT